MGRAAIQRTCRKVYASSVHGALVTAADMWQAIEDPGWALERKIGVVPAVVAWRLNTPHPTSWLTEARNRRTGGHTRSSPFPGETTCLEERATWDAWSQPNSSTMKGLGPCRGTTHTIRRPHRAVESSMRRLGPLLTSATSHRTCPRTDMKSIVLSTSHPHSAATSHPVRATCLLSHQAVVTPTSRPVIQAATTVVVASHRLPISATLTPHLVIRDMASLRTLTFHHRHPKIEEKWSAENNQCFIRFVCDEDLPHVGDLLLGGLTVSGRRKSAA